MDVEHASKPVFTDASGRREPVFRWLAVGLCACFVLVTCAVASHFPHAGVAAQPRRADRSDTREPVHPRRPTLPQPTGKLAFDAARRSLSKTPTASGAAAVGALPPSGSVAPAAPRAGERGSAAAARTGRARLARSAAEIRGCQTGRYEATEQGHTTSAGEADALAGHSPTAVMATGRLRTPTRPRRVPSRTRQRPGPRPAPRPAPRAGTTRTRTRPRSTASRTRQPAESNGRHHGGTHKPKSTHPGKSK